MEMQSLQPEVQLFIFKKYDNQGQSSGDIENYSQVPRFEKPQVPPYHNHIKRKVVESMIAPLFCIFYQEGNIGVEDTGTGGTFQLRQ